MQTTISSFTDSDITNNQIQPSNTLQYRSLRTSAAAVSAAGDYWPVFLVIPIVGFLLRLYCIYIRYRRQRQMDEALNNQRAAAITNLSSSAGISSPTNNPGVMIVQPITPSVMVIQPLDIVRNNNNNNPAQMDPQPIAAYMSNTNDNIPLAKVYDEEEIKGDATQ
jgi:hypothetical protein